MVREVIGKLRMYPPISHLMVQVKTGYMNQWKRSKWSRLQYIIMHLAIRVYQTTDSELLNKDSVAPGKMSYMFLGV